MEEFAPILFCPFSSSFLKKGEFLMENLIIYKKNYYKVNTMVIYMYFCLL